jgi:hypothetical protein
MSSSAKRRERRRALYLEETVEQDPICLEIQQEIAGLQDGVENERGSLKCPLPKPKKCDFFGSCDEFCLQVEIMGFQ